MVKKPELNQKKNKKKLAFKTKKRLSLKSKDWRSQLTKSNIILAIIGLVVVLVVIQLGVVSYRHYATNRLIDEQQMEQQSARAAYQKEQKKVKARLDKLQEEMNDYIKAQPGQIGISFYEINSQEGFNLNGKVNFIAGNMVAIPLSLVVANEIDKGNLKWKTEIPYSSSAAAANSQISQSPKSAYTVSELMKAMIEDDDATARQLLLQKIGGTTALLNYMKANDKNVGQSDKTDALEMSPQSALHFLLTLDENKNNSSAYERIQAYMSENKKNVGRLYTSKTAGDVEQLYANVDEDNAHVAGIVDTKRPFIITIFTKGQKDAEKCMSDLVNMAVELEEK